MICNHRSFKKRATASGTVFGFHEVERKYNEKNSLEMSNYKCKVCGYTYHEGNEDMEVAFAELEDSWSCPLCGAAKSQFEVVDSVNVTEEV